MKESEGGGGWDATWNGINFHWHIMMWKLLRRRFFFSLSRSLFSFSLVLSSENISTWKISSYTLDMPITNTKRNMLSPLFVVGVERGCNSHIFSNSTHIHSHIFIETARIFSISLYLYLSNVLFFSLSLVKLLNYLSQCKVKLAFALKNKIQQDKYKHKHKHILLFKRFFYGKVSIQWKSMQRPFQSTINEIFVYVWTLNLAQTK